MILLAVFTTWGRYSWRTTPWHSGKDALCGAAIKVYQEGGVGLVSVSLRRGALVKFSSESASMIDHLLCELPGG